MNDISQNIQKSPSKESKESKLKRNNKKPTNKYSKK